MEHSGIPPKMALLVDCTGELRRVMQPLLEARGYNVCVMNSALEALQIAVAAHFDAGICDLEGFGTSRAAFETALHRAQPELEKRCIFIAPKGAGANRTSGSGNALVCTRPLDPDEILRDLAFLAATPLAENDFLLTD